MQILVPSYGRAGHATTMGLLKSAKIVVPQSQFAEYELHYPKRVIAIDDKLDGNIAKKRNALLNLIKENELFWMVDDDLQKVIAIKHGEVSNIENLMESHFNLMESNKSNFGGFSIYIDPVKYTEYSPFSFTKPSYGIICIRKTSGINYDETLGRFEDVDYFLKVIHKKGKVLRDNRFYFQFQCNKDKKSNQIGGIDGSEKDYQSSLQKLIDRWGDVIKIKDGKMSGINQPIKGV